MATTSPPPDSKAVADEFVSIVTHAMKRSSSPMVEFAERHELSFTQLKLVFVLVDSAAPLSIGQLAETMGVSLPSAGRAVDGLVRQELATRSEDPEDRRVKLVEPTALADKEIHQVYEHRIATLRALLDGLTPEELNDLAAAIAPLRKKSLACPDSRSEQERR